MQSCSRPLVEAGVGSLSHVSSLWYGPTRLFTYQTFPYMHATVRTAPPMDNVVDQMLPTQTRSHLAFVLAQLLVWSTHDQSYPNAWSCSFCVVWRPMLRESGPRRTD